MNLAIRALALSVLFLAACGGSDGEPCQEEDDCTSGLLCCPLGRPLSARGTCQAECTEVVMDAATDADAAEGDAGDAEADADDDDADDDDADEPDADADVEDAEADADIEDAHIDADARADADAESDASDDADAEEDAADDADDPV